MIRRSEWMTKILMNVRASVWRRLFFVFAAATAAESVPCEPLPLEPISIAVQAHVHPDLDVFIRRTLSEVETALQDTVIFSDVLSVEELLDPAVVSNYQYVIASAPVFSTLERFAGFASVASIRPVESLSTETASAAVILVPAKGNQSVTYKSLRHARLGIPSTDAFEVSMLVRAELQWQGLDQAFFKFVSIDGSATQLIDVLKSGAVDAVAVPSLWLRSLDQGGLKVVEPRLNLEMKLAHSTAAAPGWAMASSIRTSREEGENMGALLKSLDEHEGLVWEVPADYRSIHQILRLLDDPLYHRLGKQSLAELAREYAVWIALLMMVAVGLLLHSARADRLVRRRTLELERMHQARQEAEERYATLERASIVGQMSSLVAHELRQPLAAVSNYLMGARRRLRNGDLEPETLLFALERALFESARANSIVEHVQDYARKRPQKLGVGRERINASELVAAIASDYADSQGQSRVECSAAPGLFIEADRLEMELAVKNLLKNALEAGRANGHPMVVLQAYPDADHCLRIEITDQGRALDEAAFHRLQTPMNSTKPDGLGLGLAIVRRIIESHGGHLEFQRRVPQGLAVSIVLPLCRSSS